MSTFLSTSAHPYPRVGVALFVIKDGKILLGLRHGSHGANTWGTPGGKLELGESWQDCSLREVAEEVGCGITQPEFLAATNDVFEERLHYVTIFMKAMWQAGDIQNLEPEKCLEWQWFDPAQLPDNLMLPILNLRKEHDLAALLGRD